MVAEALSFPVARARRGSIELGPGRGQAGRGRPGRVVAFGTPGARPESVVDAAHGLPPEVVAILPAAEVRVLVALYRDAVPCGPATDPWLAATLCELLAIPGDMLHGQLASGVGTALGLRPVVARSLALAVELFHGAAQALAGPASMTTGEAAPQARTTLAALALVHQGHAVLAAALRDVPAGRRGAASALVGACLGVDGALGGQARALDVDPTSAHEPTAADALAVAAGRSVPLLRLALELPAIVAGASVGTLESLCGLARAWGLAGEVEVQLAIAQRQRPARVAPKARAKSRRRGGTDLVAAVGWSAALAMLDSLLDESWELVRELAGSVPTAALAELQMALVVGRTRLPDRLEGGR